MEPEASLPCSQESTIDPYPELNESNPYFLMSILILSYHLRSCVQFRNMQFFSRWGVLNPLLTPQDGATPCRLSATAYSIYPQPPCISGGLFLHPQPDDKPCRGDRGPN
jgi:hypothetical protein